MADADGPPPNKRVAPEVTDTVTETRVREAVTENLRVMRAVYDAHGSSKLPLNKNGSPVTVFYPPSIDVYRQKQWACLTGITVRCLQDKRWSTVRLCEAEFTPRDGAGVAPVNNGNDGAGVLDAGPAGSDWTGRVGGNIEDFFTGSGSDESGSEDDDAGLSYNGTPCNSMADVYALVQQQTYDPLVRPVFSSASSFF